MKYDLLLEWFKSLDFTIIIIRYTFEIYKYIN